MSWLDPEESPGNLAAPGLEVGFGFCAPMRQRARADCIRYLAMRADAKRQLAALPKRGCNEWREPWMQQIRWAA